MIREFFNFALKTMKARKLNTFITIIGLVITASTITFFFSLFQKFTRSEGFMINGDRVIMNTYAVRFKDQTNHGSGLCYKYIKDYIETMPEVEAHTITGSNLNSHWKNGVRIAANTGFVDAGFDDVFHLDMLSGSFFSDEQDKNEEKVIVLSRKTAMELFGRIDVVGESTDVFGDFFTIIGVYEDIPEIYSTAFMSFSFDELVPIGHDPHKNRAVDESSNSYRYNSAIKLFSDAHVNAVKQKVREAAKTYVAYDDRTLFLHPFTLKDMFFSDIIGHRGQVTNFQLRGIFFAIISLSAILVVITIINLSNLKLTMLYNRIVEVGVRQSFGAYNRHLLNQFTIEVMINTTIAAILSVSLLAGFLSAFSYFRLFAHTNYNLTIESILICISLTYLIGFLTIAFPTLKLFRSRPAHSLRGVIA
ncbi:MAG: ABC transporter permease [Calditrichaeota bacterium]|nr:ABC transporter permease [Calditrichota bacterium]